MMWRTGEERKAMIQALKMLGETLAGWRDDQPLSGMYDFRGRIEDRIRAASVGNPWFTDEFVRMSLRSWAEALAPFNIDRWVSMYPLLQQSKPAAPKTVAVIMAGNIPMVGLHDLISVLISGHQALVKLSDSDRHLIPLIVEILRESYPELNGRVKFADGFLKAFDAVIATGSDNTFRYFHHYFGKYPHIIRRNRNSMAVLDGRESFANLDDLCYDIFSYFGMGCRSVSKLFVPRGYDFDDLITLFGAWNDVGNHHHYRNNYDYRKSIMMINRIPFIDHPNVLLTENEMLTSPLAVLHYTQYDAISEVKQFVASHAGDIQCIVGNSRISNQMVSFGETQSPALWEYADGVDTLAFLVSLS